MSRVAHEPAFLLHARAYRETSALLEMLTRNHGRVGLLYKGVRRSRKRMGQLHPFCPLELAWSGRGELHTLTSLELIGASRLSAARHKICGLYLNELIMNFTPRGSPSEELYGCYDGTLRRLDTGGEIESVLRRFEIHLLKLSGYGPQFEFEAASERAINPEAYYYYDNEHGPVLSPVEGVRATPLVSGRTMLALHAWQTWDPTSALESKRLLRGIIDYQLRGKPLISRDIMRYLEGASSKPLELSADDSQARERSAPGN
jgi:DNA repair protein RecO (recombination protein O)